MTMRDELPECASRSLDGPSCAREGVRIVDLDSAAGEQWWFELKRYCGGGRMFPLEDSGFSVTCQDGTTTALQRSGGAGGIPTAFTATPHPNGSPRWSSSLVLFTENGWLGSLASQGSHFTWTKPGHNQIGAQVAPTNNVVRWPIYAEVGEGRLVVGYVPTTGDQYPEGLAVFNMVDGVIERELPSYDISRSMIASGPDTLIATTTDGRLIEITVSTGAVRDLAPLGANPEGVALVR